ncbi:hypothetical protein DENIS_2064 [Desulfonema ishimotonii]|uniref:DUF4124 domain-containing protein n=1 Tax=Desulfonema ishimotonii TaxID=45657 RepID=A0A401FVY3_9BACT|nr:trypsin-like peptidase domain-containing protein [Desulfonema ishimotonii]GBC61104.1 hypothetical protein DENIS_2064 [Desulfonema ishimotonii]
MKKMIWLVPLFFFTSILCCNLCTAEIYKYKDENGVWRFTDSPTASPESTTSPESMEVVRGTAGDLSGLQDLEKALNDKFRPRNAIEKASLGTVTVKTPAGTGSGFFITNDGYILTNKHVIRGDENRQRETRKYIGKVDNRVKQIKKDFRAEKERLRKTKTYLDNYRKSVNAIKKDTRKNRAIREAEEAKYAMELEKYNAWKKDYEERKRDFESNRRQYETDKISYKRSNSIAQLTQTFKIILKDDTELDVYLVSASSQYDLALLKLDRYKTPKLTPAQARQVAQGGRVYAIGSPIGLGDSVSSGVLSGFDRGYIQTNAQIYPGNSGGPLINESGEVIGINTLKQITYKFEGLGFAIPVQKAISEFGIRAN